MRWTREVRPEEGGWGVYDFQRRRVQLLLLNDALCCAATKELGLYCFLHSSCPRTFDLDAPSQFLHRGLETPRDLKHRADKKQVLRQIKDQSSKFISYKLAILHTNGRVIRGVADSPTQKRARCASHAPDR